MTLRMHRSGRRAARCAPQPCGWIAIGVRFIPAVRFRRTQFTALLCGLLLLGVGGGARAQDPTVRILLVGDSWPGFMWAERSLRTALNAAGLGTYEEKGDVTAIGGSRASDWAQPAWLQLITDEIGANPTIDIVHLSIGGNDILGGPLPV